MRRAALVIAIALVVSGGGFASLTPVAATDDDYPTSIAHCSHYPSGAGDFACDLRNSPPNTYYDPWKFVNANCTSFVAWRLNARNRVSFSNAYGGVRWGHAYEWDDAAKKLGLRVDHTPAVGAVAHWQPGDPGTSEGGVGHVAWVSAVHADGTVDVEEYNKHNDGRYSRRTRITAPRYIHIKDIAPLKYQVFSADFNGDGKSDIGLRRISSGALFVRYGPTFATEKSFTWASGSNFQPFAGDFDGDRRSDIGLRKVSTGTLYVRLGVFPAAHTQKSFTWASGSNFQPFAGDFDGDRRSDIGLRKISTGTIYVRLGVFPSAYQQKSYAWASG